MSRRIASLAILALTTSLLIPAAKAEVPAPHDPTKVPVFVKLITDGWTPHFLTHDEPSDLDVWYVTMPDNTPQTVYTRPDGKTMLRAQIYVQTAGAAELENVTGKHILEATALMAAARSYESSPPSSEPQQAKQEVIPPSTAVAPPPEPARPPIVTFSLADGKQPVTRVTGASLLAAFEGAHYIEAGQPSAPLIYAVIDPNCGYCHAFWQSIRPSVAAGKVRVRIIVSLALGSGSLLAATKIMAAQDPLTVWDALVDRRKIVPAPPPPSGARELAARKQVVDNETMRHTILDRAKLPGVPFILSRDRATGKIGFHHGIDAEGVHQLLESLSDLQQPVANP